MRSITVALTLAVGLTVAAPGIPVAAQEADGTPPPTSAPAGGSLEIAPGVVAEALAFLPGVEVPAVYRLRLDAGSTYDFTGDPSIAMAVVESGAITLTADAPLTVQRGSATGSAGEHFAASEAVDLAVGDHLIVPALASGQLRNGGSEPAAIVVASLPGPAAAAEASAAATFAL